MAAEEKKETQSVKSYHQMGLMKQPDFRDVGVLLGPAYEVMSMCPQQQMLYILGACALMYIQWNLATQSL